MATDATLCHPTNVFSIVQVISLLIFEKQAAPNSLDGRQIDFVIVLQRKDNVVQKGASAGNIIVLL